MFFSCLLGVTMIRSDRVKVENEEGKYLSETILNVRLKSHVLKQMHYFQLHLQKLFTTH